MKKLITSVVSFFAAATIFAQSSAYTAYLAKAKEYAGQKKWCHALECYYDAIGCDDEAAVKEEAYKSFKELEKAIRSGNPGLGKFNAFTLHDEWKNLLIDAEQVGSSFSKWQLTLGDLVQGDLDYTKRTATYSSKIYYTKSERYISTIGIVADGYKKAYKDDWSADLPKDWPAYSASSKKNTTYNVDGALVYAKKKNSREDNFLYMNAFEGDISDDSPYLFDYKFNIVDESGKELVKGVRWLLGQSDSVTFTGVTPDVMDLIDNGKAFINPVAAYLEYGQYNEADYDSKNKRAFIKNFPEVQLPMEKNVFICWNNKRYYVKTYLEENFVEIPGKDFAMGKTEVTQAQYEAVMGENPSYYKGENNPVEKVSWYDAIYFCNKLSLSKGLEPVYSVDGSTDVSTWGYTPHKGNSIYVKISQNIEATGFRLPTKEEWQYAAKGGQDYTYAGSDNLDEVGWYDGNSGSKTHPVAEKKANSYGLYDMSGNVWEWVWASNNGGGYRCNCGGSYYNGDGGCEVGVCGSDCADYCNDNLGFRLVCPLNALE